MKIFLLVTFFAFFAYADENQPFTNYHFEQTFTLEKIKPDDEILEKYKVAKGRICFRSDHTNKRVFLALRDVKLPDGQFTLEEDDIIRDSYPDGFTIFDHDSETGHVEKLLYSNAFQLEYSLYHSYDRHSEISKANVKAQVLEEIDGHKCNVSYKFYPEGDFFKVEKSTKRQDCDGSDGLLSLKVLWKFRKDCLCWKYLAKVESWLEFDVPWVENKGTLHTDIHLCTDHVCENIVFPSNLHDKEIKGNFESQYAKNRFRDLYARVEEIKEQRAHSQDQA